MSSNWMAVSAILISTFLMAEGANILMMPSSLFPIHRLTMIPLAEELIRRGHNIHWFEYGLKKPNIPLPSGVKEEYLEVNVDSQTIRDVYLHKNHSIFERIWNEDFWDEAAQSSGWLASIELCDSLLTEKRAEFDKLVNTKFDAVVLDDLYNPCGLFHTSLQKSVFIYWSMTSLRTESAWAHHSPSPPSYIPVPGTGLTDELDFWQRAGNLLAYGRSLYVHQHLILRRVDKLAAKHFGADRLVESFYMERNASLNFVNNPPIFDFARPYMPRVNFVGGLHCRKAKPLPQDLENFVSKANAIDGFVLITSGHSNQWKFAPQQIKANLLDAIRSKPNIQFVWQYNGAKLSNSPKNLLIQKWLPQQDLLGHPLCRAHISHGGLNSVIESVWHGVPVIGWPLKANEYDNLLRVTARHAGIMIEQKRPTRNQILSALNRIYVQHYREETLIFQDMLIDVPYSELNHSAFWVEFIVRHGEIPHARSGADELNVIQYFLVDVITFILSTIIIALFLTVYLIRFSLLLIIRLIRLLFTSKTVKTKKD